MAEPAPLPVGLYGGSFNPPHIAHVLVAAWALGSGQVGELWIIPTGGHPFGKTLAPFEDRIEMCRRAFACFGDRIRLLDTEREPRVHYSIDTLRALAGAHPGRRWRWIMGSDTLADAPRWRQYDELVALAPPLVIPRRGHGGAVAPAGFALPDLSSTLVRRLLAEGAAADLAALLPLPVLDWIDRRGLYRHGDPS